MHIKLPRLRQKKIQPLIFFVSQSPLIFFCVRVSFPILLPAFSRWWTHNRIIYLPFVSRTALVCIRQKGLLKTVKGPHKLIEGHCCDCDLHVRLFYDEKFFSKNLFVKKFLFFLEIVRVY